MGTMTRHSFMKRSRELWIRWIRRSYYYELKVDRTGHISRVH